MAAGPPVHFPYEVAGQWADVYQVHWAGGVLADDAPFGVIGPYTYANADGSGDPTHYEVAILDPVPLPDADAIFNESWHQSWSIYPVDATSSNWLGAGSTLPEGDYNLVVVRSQVAAWQWAFEPQFETALPGMTRGWQHHTPETKPSGAQFAFDGLPDGGDLMTAYVITDNSPWGLSVDAVDVREANLEIDATLAPGWSYATTTGDGHHPPLVGEYMIYRDYGNKADNITYYGWDPFDPAVKAWTPGGGHVRNNHKLKQLLHVGLVPKQAIFHENPPATPTFRELLLAGMSPRQARTWLRGDHSVDALIRGGFTKAQALVITEA